MKLFKLVPFLLGGLRLRSHRALYTRIACHYHLAPWAPDEITQLLQANQQAVGLSDNLIDTAAIDLITHASQGLPRTALQVARAAWIAASQTKANVITATQIQSILPTIPAVSDGLTPSLT